MKKFILAIIIPLFVSCYAVLAQAKQPAPEEPPSECYCAECGMVIQGESRKFASEMIFSDGKKMYFCDLGDLFLYYEVLKDRRGIAAIYVKDHPSGSWMEGRSGYFLTNAGVTTPMRYGILAFKKKADAERYKKEKGGDKIYTFNEVLSSRVYRR